MLRGAGDVMALSLPPPLRPHKTQEWLGTCSALSPSPGGTARGLLSPPALCHGTPGRCQIPPALKAGPSCRAALHTLYIKYTAVQWVWNILSMNWWYWRIYILTPCMWELRKICPRKYFQRKCWAATLFVLFKIISGLIMSLYQNYTCAEHAQCCVLWAIQEGVDLIYFFIMNIVVL